VRLFIAYWPSQWQAATTEETVVDMVFGVFTSRGKAVETVKSSISSEDWNEYKDEFVYEELDVDTYHPIPHV